MIINRLLILLFTLQIFTELDELDLVSGEWVEKARWIKYEQTVEEEADRWGKPQVSSLAFHSVVELTKCLEFGEYLLWSSSFVWNLVITYMYNRPLIYFHVRGIRVIGEKQTDAHEAWYVLAPLSARNLFVLMERSQNESCTVFLVIV